MVRPKATELTSRELAVMHIFWRCTECTAEEARNELEMNGEALAYATVANVVRGLAEKGVLEQVNNDRPYRFRATRSFSDVSTNLIGDLISRVFSGSRESMLVHLFSQTGLTESERTFLADLLNSSSDTTGDAS